MKTLITASAIALALSSSFAAAEPFEFEKAWASVDLDPSFHITNYTRPADWMSSDVKISLEEVNRGNPEIDWGLQDYQPVEFTGEDLPTSYDVFTQGNPEYDWNV
jgi:hypothetical protein